MIIGVCMISECLTLCLSIQLISLGMYHCKLHLHALVHTTNNYIRHGVMSDVVITVNRVKDVLHDLNVNSAVEPDSVHPRLLRACAHEVSVATSDHGG